MRYFVFADAHGFYDELMHYLEQSGFDSRDPTHMLICCGDTFDRGRQPGELLDFFKEMKKINKIILIRGNHEDLLLECLERERAYPYDYSNKTVQTIVDLYNYYFKKEESVYFMNFPKICRELKEKTDIYSFINDNFIDYYETKMYLFVHGFIPCEVPVGEKPSIIKNWRVLANDLDWNSARWLNSMEMVKKHRLIEPRKTIIAGHWHASYGNVRDKYGWSMSDEVAKKYEFVDFHYFSPYRTKGLIAIDACTAISGMINVIVLDDEVIKNDE